MQFLLWQASMSALAPTKTPCVLVASSTAKQQHASSSATRGRVPMIACRANTLSSRNAIASNSNLFTATTRGSRGCAVRQPQKVTASLILGKDPFTHMNLAQQSYHRRRRLCVQDPTLRLIEEEDKYRLVAHIPGVPASHVKVSSGIGINELWCRSDAI